MAARELLSSECDEAMQFTVTGPQIGGSHNRQLLHNRYHQSGAEARTPTG